MRQNACRALVIADKRLQKVAVSHRHQSGTCWEKKNIYSHSASNLISCYQPGLAEAMVSTPYLESNGYAFNLLSRFERGLITTARRISAVCYELLSSFCTTTETTRPCPHSMLQLFREGQCEHSGSLLISKIYSSSL